MWDKHYDGLCISAGAIGGYYHLGAIHYFYSHTKCLKNTKYYAGTSVGALISCLLALGFTPLELITYTCNFDINSNMKIDVNDLHDTWGLIDINSLEDYVTNLVLSKFKKVPTFKELYDEHDKVFICTTYQITQDETNVNKCKIMSYKTEPELSVIKAALLSCSIPLLFKKNVYNNNIFLDGAVFDRTCLKPINEYCSNDLNTNYKILCIDLMDNVKISKENLNFKEYCLYLFKLILDIQERPKDTNNVKVLNIVRENDISDFTLYLNIKRRIDLFVHAYRFVKGIKQKKD